MSVEQDHGYVQSVSVKWLYKLFRSGVCVLCSSASAPLSGVAASAQV